MLYGLAAAFAVINGVNDGGAMIASGLRVPGQRAIYSVAALAAALVAIPLLWGTGVAETLASGLVGAPPRTQPALVATGVVAAIIVVGGLSRAGLPTSLTLGMVGGIVGAGLGRGMPVIVTGVVRVMLIGLAAPAVGALLAQLLVKVSVAVLAGAGVGGLAALGWLAMAAQALAYAANDGQKMFAVLAVTSAGITLPLVACAAVLFAVGASAGVRAAAGTLGRNLARGAPAEEVTARLGGSVAVLSSAALGVPVSMTQAIAGGLVGTGMLRGLHQVRWRIAGRLMVAWVLTLPAAALTGSIIARIGRGIA